MFLVLYVLYISFCTCVSLTGLLLMHQNV
uniref:Uncharacterized protein n=1 Tax=Anguilla anguilla TaxID=7936 RepID=A0A0E9R2Q7_ANGAN